MSIPISKFGVTTAISIVVANMIGTGVFTSLGYQLADIRSVFVLLMLWVVGGIVALCGALCYAELGTALPRSGGEYNFLSRVFHPGVGFVSGWVSATIGFAAPTALVAITFASYLGAVFPSVPQTFAACLLIVVLALAHGFNRRGGAMVQVVFTSLKVVLILAFCLLPWILAVPIQPVSLVPVVEDAPLLFGGAFAVSLIYVNYAYTGWNAATYIVGELSAPQQQLPRILIVGTLTVMVLYIMLNAVFLLVAPMDAMVNKIEIGYIAAQYMMGEAGAKVMGMVLALLLVSTASAMTLAGPRVLQVIGEDFQLFRFLRTTNSQGIPSVAIWFQSAFALVFVLTASFESILVFSGFTLGLCTLVTVIALMVLRVKQPDLPRPYRVNLYPLPPLIYIGITGWTLFYILLNRPQEGWLGIGIFSLGAGLYWVFREKTEPPKS